MTRFRIDVTNEDTGETLSKRCNQDENGRVTFEIDAQHTFQDDEFFELIEKIENHQRILAIAGHHEGYVQAVVEQTDQAG